MADPACGALRGRGRRVEERDGGAADVQGLGPGAGEPAAAVEQGRVAAGVLPAGGVLLDLLGDEPRGPLRVHPAAQPRPRPDQGLVADLYGAVVDGDEPGSGEAVQHVSSRRGQRVQQSVAGGAPAGVGDLVAGPHETQQECAGHLADDQAAGTSWVASAVLATAPATPPMSR